MMTIVLNGTVGTRIVTKSGEGGALALLLEHAEILGDLRVSGLGSVFGLAGWPPCKAPYQSPASYTKTAQSSIPKLELRLRSALAISSSLSCSALMVASLEVYVSRSFVRVPNRQGHQHMRILLTFTSARR